MATRHLQLSMLLVITFHGLSARVQNSARVQTHKNFDATSSGSTFIAGVPIYNYHHSHTSRSASKGGVAEDWMLVMKEGTSDVEEHDVCRECGCVALGHPSEGGFPCVTFHGTMEELQALFECAPGVFKFVEPDMEVSVIPEVPDLVSEDRIWGLQRIGSSEQTGTGHGVNVYVLDTGIRTTHVEFGDRAHPAMDMTSGSIEVCSESGCAGDTHGHGTHAAGTVAGTTYGVAPEATVRAVKVLGDSGNGPLSWMTVGLDWIASSGLTPSVASLSLGAGAVIPTFEVAIDAAVAAGVVVVVAAGNKNIDACTYSPAYVASAITVGSIELGDWRSNFSNWGACVDIWAPGTDILSASNNNDHDSVSMSGTSMACPHVSGAVARLLQNNSSSSPELIRQQLLGNTERNAISDLTTVDTNKLLWVGADKPRPHHGPLPPTRPPTPPCVSNTSGLSVDPWLGFLGECACTLGAMCFKGGVRGCPGQLGDTPFYYLPHCRDCICMNPPS